MRLSFSKNTNPKIIARLKKRVRIRKRVKGTEERPRVSVFKSKKHMYAQVVDDVTGRTLVSASTLKMSLDGKNGKEKAQAVGEALAKLAVEKKIKDVVFDRSGYVYHGRIQSLAAGLRDGGLNF